jgi:hypothetical protein
VAADDVTGDFWIIYGKGERQKSEVFVADAGGILPKGNGVQSLMVIQIFQDYTLPILATYETEVQCAKRQIRFANAQAMRRFDSAMMPLPVSHDWQPAKDYWVQRTVAFVCAPGNRANNAMLSMGKMPPGQMVETVQQMFIQLAPIEAKADAMKDLDAMLGNSAP